MDKTIILKQTNKGLVIDSIASKEDTIFIKTEYHAIVSIPDNSIKVILPEKSNLEISSTWAAIIGGFAGLFAAYAAIKQLYKKDKIKEKQIEQLIKQTEEIKEQTKISQARLRLIVKPRIWNNTTGFVNGRIEFDLNNRGELAFYDGFEILTGDNISFKKPTRPIEIPREGRIVLTAPCIDKERNEIEFAIKIFYHDQEDFKYETIFDLKNETIKLRETIEL